MREQVGRHGVFLAWFQKPHGVTSSWVPITGFLILREWGSVRTGGEWESSGGVKAV